MTQPVFERLQVNLSDRYVIERQLGSGGMATVYLARDLRHGRSVALKVLRPELAAVLGPERFLREIHIAAQLNHPHILPLFDSGETAGQLWYVMPLVEGESLRERLTREGQLPLEDALAITREVADALGFAHSRGIVHRDIKPANILLSGGHALVADLGIARALAPEVGTLTETGMVVGTPGYMSPEQASGEGVVDARSDLYALGSVLYEMLAGEPPYTGPTTQAILAKQLVDPVPSVRRLRDTVPPGVDEALRHALAKAPADRFATAAQFTAALTQLAPQLRETPTQLLGQRLAARRRWALGAITALAVLGLAIGAVLATGKRSGPSFRPAVIVAPFENRSADTLDAYLAATLTEDLSAALSAGHAIRLISARGDRRAADYLVSGSVRRTGDSIAMTAALERSGSGEIVWTARRSWMRGQGISVADTLAAGVLLALGVEQGPPSTPRRLQAHPVDPEAYDLYLRARYQLARRRQTNTVQSVTLFSQAVSRDSTFALAWAGLARALQFASRRQFVVPGVPRDSLVARELAASERAIELDSTNAYVWLAYAWVAWDVDPTERTAVLRAVRRALALDSLSAEAWHLLGLTLEELGDPGGAVRTWRRAVAVLPDNIESLAFLGGHYWWARHFDSAAVWADSAVLIDPTYSLGRQFAGHAALARGRLAKAEAHFSASRRLSTGSDLVQPLAGLAQVAVASGDHARAPALLAEAEAVTDLTAPALHSAVDLAEGYASLGDTARALRWLEAYSPRADLHFQLHLRLDPPLDPLRSLPRFQALLRKVP